MGSWELEIYAWLTIWNYFDLMQPQRPPTEKLLKFNMSFHDSVEKLLLNKHQNKMMLLLKLIEFKNLEDSEVHSSDFPGLRNFSSLIDLCGLCNLTGLNSL